MTRTFVVARYVTLQWVRHKIVWVSVLAGAAIVLFAMGLGPLMQVDPGRLVRDLGLAGVELSGVLILLLLSGMTYFDEAERRSLTVVLVKPVSKGEYLGGLLLGFCGVLLVSSASLAAFTFAGVWAAGGTGLLAGILPAAFLLFVELCLLATLVVLFLQQATSLVGAFLYPLGAFVAGAFSPTLRYFAEHADSAALAWTLRVVRVLAPNFELFNLKNEPGAVGSDASFVVAALAYAVVYGSAAMLVARVGFARREH